MAGGILRLHGHGLAGPQGSRQRQSRHPGGIAGNGKAQRDVGGRGAAQQRQHPRQRHGARLVGQPAHGVRGIAALGAGEQVVAGGAARQPGAEPGHHEPAEQQRRGRPGGWPDVRGRKSHPQQRYRAMVRLADATRSGCSAREVAPVVGGPAAERLIALHVAGRFFRRSRGRVAREVACSESSLPGWPRASRCRPSPSMSRPTTADGVSPCLNTFVALGRPCPIPTTLLSPATASVLLRAAGPQAARPHRPPGASSRPSSISRSRRHCRRRLPPLT